MAVAIVTHVNVNVLLLVIMLSVLANFYMYTLYESSIHCPTVMGQSNWYNNFVIQEGKYHAF